MYLLEVIKKTELYAKESKMLQEYFVLMLTLKLIVLKELVLYYQQSINQIVFRGQELLVDGMELSAQREELVIVTQPQVQLTTSNNLIA